MSVIEDLISLLPDKARSAIESLVSQPNWLQRAQAQDQALTQAYQGGGMPGVARELYNNPQQTADLASGFVGSTTPVKGIRAYHGSPYDFEKFDASKIGTGEGAQVYGHGLYFAENPTVAADYRRRLAGEPMPKLDPWKIKNELADVGGFSLESINFARQTLADYRGNPDEALRTLDGLFANTGYSRAKEAAHIIRSMSPSVEKVTPGRMYEVNINAEPQQFLQWDKSVAEQPALKDIWSPTGANDYHTGATLYSALASKYNPETVSNTLQSQGIPGIRYLDQGSRNVGQLTITPPQHTVAGDWMVKGNDYNSKGAHFPTEAEAQAYLKANQANQTSNYVVFNPAIVDILKKWGLAVSPIGGLMAADAVNNNQQ